MGTQATQSTAPQSSADRAGAVGHETKAATKDVAATAGAEAQRVSREATDQVRQLWGQTRTDLTDQASTQQARAASSLRELAEQLGQMAQSSDQGGMAAGLVDDVARRAGDAASWLDSRDPGSLLDEARSFARRRPGAFLAVAAGLGVVAGRMSRSLVDEARDETSGSTGSSGTSELPDAGYADTTPIGSGSLTTGDSPDVLSGGGAAVPGDELPRAHRSSQPFMPDGTPTPIDDDGLLAAPSHDVGTARGER